MNAVEFIKQYGWGKSKLVISEWNNYFNQYEVIKMPTHYNSNLEIFVCEDDFIKNLDDSCVCIKELKKFVDAWELVEKVGGLLEAKYYIKTRHIFEMDALDIKLSIAIELVESVNESN